MITETGRRHLAAALRRALHIRPAHALAILDTVRNANLVRIIDGPLHGVYALIDAQAETATFFRETGGRHRPVASVRLKPEDLARWHALPLDQAYPAIPVVEGLDPPFGSDALDAFVDPEEIFDMTRDRGPSDWMHGMIQTVSMSNGFVHVEALIEGDETACALIPALGSTWEAAQHANSLIGVPVALWIEDPAPNRRDLGAASHLPVIGMVRELSEVKAEAFV